MSDQGLLVARAMNEAAKIMHQSSSLEETLDSITRAALQTIPGFNHGGISITHRDGRIETKSGTDRLVWDLDEVQYSLREGPCYDAITGVGIAVVENARHDQRWPNYLPKAVQRGLRAQLAVGLYDDDQSLGGLNLYSTESDAIDPAAVDIAELFAGQAALALGRSRQVTQLSQALESRKIIGQAIGIVQERYGLDEAKAFRFLTRTSSTSNVKLRDVAMELVRTANEHRPS